MYFLAPDVTAASRAGACFMAGLPQPGDKLKAPCATVALQASAATARARRYASPSSAGEHAVLCAYRTTEEQGAASGYQVALAAAALHVLPGIKQALRHEPHGMAPPRVGEPTSPACRRLDERAHRIWVVDTVDDPNGGAISGARA